MAVGEKRLIRRPQWNGRLRRYKCEASFGPLILARSGSGHRMLVTKRRWNRYER